MRIFNYTEIIQKAWLSFDPKRNIKSITDVSARVSTNHVYKIVFQDGHVIFAKLSYFGNYDHFKEDHAIINCLGNNLEPPFENFLAKSLMKGNEVYTYRYNDELMDVWVVFYKPIEIKFKLPKRLNEQQIEMLGKQLALFHQSCSDMLPSLPESSKTMESDLRHLLEILETPNGKFIHRNHEDYIKSQCDLFFNNSEKTGYKDFENIPVFVDWNIGNFSVTEDTRLFSRWDYDWFRMCPRMMDFYFFSRVCSTIGDKTHFSYLIDPMLEHRFLLFLKAYNEVSALTPREIFFMKETYRFFILNYVIKDGRYFFHEIYAHRLQREAYEIYFPQLDEKFKPEKIIEYLNL